MFRTDLKPLLRTEATAEGEPSAVAYFVFHTPLGGEKQVDLAGDCWSAIAGLLEGGIAGLLGGGIVGLLGGGVVGLLGTELRRQLW